MMKPFSKIKGDFAEFLAAFYLLLKGYCVIERNLKGPFAEIDLLCVKKNTLVAVEVKYRKSHLACHGAVSFNQSRRQNRQLKLFLSKYPEYEHYRIDYVFVFPTPWFIKHVVAVNNE